MKIHVAVQRHAAVLGLEGHVAPTVDTHARAINGVAKQQRHHGDFTCSEETLVTRAQAVKTMRTH